jgi:hypothetical protein
MKMSKETDKKDELLRDWRERMPYVSIRRATKASLGLGDDEFADAEEVEAVESSQETDD